MKRFLLALLMIQAILANAQVFRQSFSGSSNPYTYIGSSQHLLQSILPVSGTSSTDSALVTITSDGLTFEKSVANTNAVGFTRSTDMVGATGCMFMKFDITVTSPGNQTSGANHALQFSIGQGFTSTSAAFPGSAAVHSKFGVDFNYSAINGSYVFKGYNGATTVARSIQYTGKVTVTWVVNNSGSAVTYTAPNGNLEAVGNDTYDVWVGNSKVFNDYAAITPSLSTITDFRFSYVNGTTGKVSIGNILVDDYSQMTANGDYINIAQTSIGNIFLPGDDKKINVRTNGDSIRWRYYDYWNVMAGAGGKAVVNDTASIILSPGKLGWYRLVVDADTAGSLVSTGETDFAVLSSFSPSSVANSPFSVQTHWWQNYDTLIPIAAKLGVKYVRDCILWSDVEKAKGVYTFPAKYDTLLSKLSSNGMKLYTLLAASNSLYDGGNSPVSGEARLAYADYGKQVLQRYPAIADIEIWNEPDLPTFTPGLTTEAQRIDFCYNLVKTAYEQIKPSYPAVAVNGYALSTNSEYATGSFLDSLYSKGALDNIDEYSFHAYTVVPEDLLQSIRRQQQFMRTYNNDTLLKINLSESGNSSATVNEFLQAKYTPRRIVTALAAGMSKVSIYNLQNKDTLNSDRESTYGLLRHPMDIRGAYVPKPAYTTYATLIRELSNAVFDHTEDSTIFYSHVFIKDSLEKRVIYALSDMDITLHTPGSLLVTDIMGNSTTHIPSGGLIQLHLTDDVQYITGFIDSIVPVQRFAQIGFGTETPSITQFAPVYKTTSVTGHNRSSILFTAAEMAEAGIPAGAKILSIQFNKTTTAVLSTPASYSVYMFNKSDTSLSTATTWSAILDSSTLVYANSSFNLPYAPGWVNWNIDTFTYAGNGLQISFEAAFGGIVGTGSVKWQYTAGVPLDKIISTVPQSSPNETVFGTTLNSTNVSYRLRPNIRIVYVTVSPVEESRDNSPLWVGMKESAPAKGSGNNFFVYPNPFSEKLRMRINAVNASNVVLTVSDLSGSVVGSYSMSLTKGDNDIELNNLSSLSKGIYLIRISGGLTGTFKVMKK